ncbi:MAG: hemerythrin domain-containing protein [Terracidiphilus sp.]
MPVQIGARPDSGFDDPIGMLKDCHRRIEHFIHVLCQVAQRAQGRALTCEEWAAVEGALRYFRESGPRHNRDEEESVFPRLRAMGAAAPAAEMDRLEGEHHEAEGMHAETVRLYAKWHAGHGLPQDEEQRLIAVTGRLQKLYVEHIRLEEEDVFPRAARALDAATMETIGQEFKARRAKE